MMKTGVKVKEAMTKQPITVAEDATVEQCSTVMTQKHVGSLIVEEETLLGILTEQDVVRKVVGKGLDPKTTLVKDVMHKKLVTIHPDKDIYDAITEMNKHNIRHMPVVDENDMVGFITIKDILKVEPKLFEKVVQEFNLREEKDKPVN